MKIMISRNLVIFAFCLVIFGAGLVYYVGSQLDKAFGPKSFLGIECSEYLVIVRVIPNSPAEDVGLKPDDRIISINGVRPVSQSQVSELISKNKPGSAIEIIVSRDGQKTIFKAVLVKRPNE